MQDRRRHSQGAEAAEDPRLVMLLCEPTTTKMMKVATESQEDSAQADVISAASIPFGLVIQSSFVSSW